MAKKLTYEEVKEYIESQGYKLLSEEYVNTRTKITIQDKEGYLYSITWERFRQTKKIPLASPNNPYSIYNIRKYALKFGYELISTEYKNSIKDKLQFKCPKCKEIFDTTWYIFQHGHRCPYCCNPPQKIKLGVNTIWDTDRWMCDLGISEEDAKTNLRCSTTSIVTTCPYCGNEKETTPHIIYNKKSIGCSCGDGVSYPEKFITELLNQLNIKYTREYKPKWSNNKRYDFYFEYDNEKRCIIEVNGKQHYSNNNFSYCGGRTLQEEQDNDQYKKELALNNNIDYYIELDCRESNTEWIKNSILNSELNNLFNLNNNNIDWLKCEEFALSNKVKEVCDYWKLHNEINNEGLTTEDIGKVFNLNKTTVLKYLKKGTKLGLGWCNYNPKEEMKRQGGINGKSKGKPIEIFKNDKSLGVFPSCTELSRQSEELFGIKLFQPNIYEVCNGKKSQYKGFTFHYITKEEYQSKIP